MATVTEVKTKTLLKVAIVTLGLSGIAAAGMLMVKSTAPGKPGPRSSRTVAARMTSEGITINSPLGGVQYSCNQVNVIAWKNNFKIEGQSVQTVSIDLFRGDILVKNISESVTNSGKINFVPSSYVDCRYVTENDQFKIRISASLGEQKIEGYSGQFGLGSKDIFVNLDYPNAETDVDYDEGMTIKWNASENVPKISLVLVKNNIRFRTIANLLDAGQASFKWSPAKTLMPDDYTVEDEFRIRIIGLTERKADGVTIIAPMFQEEPDQDGGYMAVVADESDQAFSLIGGSNLDECDVDDDCENDQFCSSGSCVDCRNDVDCWNGQKCQLGKCGE